MEEEAAGGGEHAAGFDHTGAEELDEVVETVLVAGGFARVAERDGDGAVTVAAEAGSVAVEVAHRLHPQALLAVAGVEGRIDVDEVDASGRHGLEDGEVIAMQDAVQHTSRTKFAMWVYPIRCLCLLHPTI